MPAEIASTSTYEYIDEASGRLYYHHTVTKVTVWTAPLEGVSFRESDGT